MPRTPDVRVRVLLAVSEPRHVFLTYKVAVMN